MPDGHFAVVESGAEPLPAHPKKFWEKTWFAWLMVLLACPAGIYLLWKKHKGERPSGTTVSVIIVLLLLLGMFGPAFQEHAPVNPQSTPAVNAEAEPASEQESRLGFAQVRSIRRTQAAAHREIQCAAAFM